MHWGRYSSQRRMRFAHNSTNTSALLPGDSEQKEAKMACPKRLGKPTNSLRITYKKKEHNATAEKNGPGSEFKTYVS